MAQQNTPPDPIVMMAQLLQQMQQANQNTLVMMQQAQQANEQREEAARQASEQRDAALRQALDQQRKETVEMVKTLGEAMDKITSKEKTGVVDVKAVGKPEMLQGDTKEQIKQKWPLWTFGFTTWFVSQHEKAEEMLKWRAASYNGAIDEAVLDVEMATRNGWEDAHRMNKQLHVALVSLTKGETLSILRNSVAQSGFDGWRRLSREYEPQTAQSNYHLLAKVLRPTRAKDLSSLRGAIETWERLYTQYQERTSDSLSDATRRLCLQSLCPEVLSDHLDLHASRLGTYDMMRSEIDTYLDIKTSTPLTTSDPMDVDAMGEGKGKFKGKSGKGKGSSGSTVGPCHVCGRLGHIAKDCWHKSSKGSKGKDGKGKKSDGKGKGSSKGGKGQSEKGKGKGVKSLEESGKQENAEGANDKEIHAIFALEEGKPEAKALGKGASKGQESQSRGKGTGSTESFIRTVLFNLKAVEAREINRAKEDLQKTGVSRERSEALKAEIAERQSQLNLLKGRSVRFEEDPRFRQDVDAGRSVRLAKRKWKSRVRAASNRAKGFNDRAQGYVELEKKWYTRFRSSTGEDGLTEKRKRQEDRHGGRFDGDREDLQPDWVMGPLSRKERMSFREEENENEPKQVKQRNWEKPNWMKCNTPEAKKKHLKKTGWRISMLKQRSLKRKRDDGPEGQRKGSLRPSLDDRPGPANEPNLEDIADKAWARKRIKDLSHSLDEAEDEEEAARIEEEIQVQKAKVASLQPEEQTPEVRSSTAAGSPDTPQNKVEGQEETGVEEYEEIPVDKEQGPPQEENDDECWGKWKPQSCLKDLGFSEEEAASLVREYVGQESAESLEIFSVDEPAKSGEWEEVYVTVDSGSAVTCFPESMVQGYEVGQHDGPKQYTSASNHEVKAIGRAEPIICFEDWQVNKVQAVVLSPLKRPLFSTSRMVNAGWRIVHDSEENGGSFALHKGSGRMLKMTVVGGVYKMPIWVKKKGFGRRGGVP